MSKSPHPDAHHDQAHVLATTGPHTGALPLTDLEVAVQGELIVRGAADWEALGVGAADEVLTSGGAGANVSWAAAPSTDLNPSPGTDNTGSGLTATDTVGENVDPGEVLFLYSDGKYYLADANLTTEMPVKVMAMESITANNEGELLHIGYYRHDAWTWAWVAGEGNLLYAHTAPGEMVQFAAKPVGSGDQLQVLGYVVTEDIAFFNPSLVLAQIV